MIWLVGGVTALVVIIFLVGFTAWLRFLDDEAERCHDIKHRCHHKWDERR